MTPAPTPYDISQIPYFPFEPSLIHWLVVIAIFLLVVFVGLLRRSKQIQKLPAKELAVSELQALIATSNGSSSKLILSRAVQISKRFLSAIDNRDYSALTQKELEKSLGEQSSEQIREILTELVKITPLIYRPEIPTSDAQSLIGDLSTSIDRYVPQSEATP